MEVVLLDCRLGLARHCQEMASRHLMVSGTGEGAPPSVLVLLPAVFFQNREMADTHKDREQPEDQRARGLLRNQNNGIVLSGEG